MVSRRIISAITPKTLQNTTNLHENRAVGGMRRVSSSSPSSPTSMPPYGTPAARVGSDERRRRVGSAERRRRVGSDDARGAGGLDECRRRVGSAERRRRVGSDDARGAGGLDERRRRVGSAERRRRGWGRRNVGAGVGRRNGGGASGGVYLSGRFAATGAGGN